MTRWFLSGASRGRSSAAGPPVRSVVAVTSQPETPGPGRLRVVIAEDAVLLLAGLTKLLESAGFEVAATAGDAAGCWPPSSGNGPTS